MKTKISKKILWMLCLALFAGCFLISGTVMANDASDLQPAADITYNENFIVNGTGFFDSIKIGKQDVGGVTFFNGTIVNSTTTGGAENPVTFGDDVRIDGVLFRSEVGGSSPIKISDDMNPTTDDAYNLGSSANRWNGLYLSGVLRGTEANFDGDIAVSGTVDGVDVSENVAITYDSHLPGGLVSINDPNGIVQTGTYMFTCAGGSPPGATSETVTLPVAYKNAFSVTLTLNNTAWYGAPFSDITYFADPTSLNTFTIDAWSATGAPGGTCPVSAFPTPMEFQWIAVGY